MHHVHALQRRHRRGDGCPIRVGHVRREPRPVAQLADVPPPERVHAPADRARNLVERRLAHNRGVGREPRVRRALGARDAARLARARRARRERSLRLAPGRGPVRDGHGVPRGGGDEPKLDPDFQVGVPQTRPGGFRARPLGARLHDQADRARRLEHAVRGRAPGLASRGPVRRVLNQTLEPPELPPGVAPERPQRAVRVQSHRVRVPDGDVADEHAVQTAGGDPPRRARLRRRRGHGVHRHRRGAAQAPRAPGPAQLPAVVGAPAPQVARLRDRGGVGGVRGDARDDGVAQRADRRRRRARERVSGAQPASGAVPPGVRLAVRVGDADGGPRPDGEPVQVQAPVPDVVRQRREPTRPRAAHPELADVVPAERVRERAHLAEAFRNQEVGHTRLVKRLTNCARRRRAPVPYGPPVRGVLGARPDPNRRRDGAERPVREPREPRRGEVERVLNEDPRDGGVGGSRAGGVRDPVRERGKREPRRDRGGRVRENQTRRERHDPRGGGIVTGGSQSQRRRPRHRERRGRRVVDFGETGDGGDAQPQRLGDDSAQRNSVVVHLDALVPRERIRTGNRARIRVPAERVPDLRDRETRAVRENEPVFVEARDDARGVPAVAERRVEFGEIIRKDDGAQRTLLRLLRAPLRGRVQDHRTERLGNARDRRHSACGHIGGSFDARLLAEVARGEAEVRRLTLRGEHARRGPIRVARVVVRRRLGRPRARTHVHVHHPLGARARAQRVARDVRQAPVEVARGATQAIVLRLNGEKVGISVGFDIAVVEARLARRRHLHAPARARGAARVARADAARREPDPVRAGCQRVQGGAGEQTRAGGDAVRLHRAPLAFFFAFAARRAEEPRPQHGRGAGERAGDLDVHRVPVRVRREERQGKHAIERRVHERPPRRRRDDGLSVDPHRRDGGFGPPVRVCDVRTDVHDHERECGVRCAVGAARVAAAGLGREPDAVRGITNGAGGVGAGARRAVRERNRLALLPVRSHLEQRAARHDRRLRARGLAAKQGRGEDRDDTARSRRPRGARGRPRRAFQGKHDPARHVRVLPGEPYRGRRRDRPRGRL